MNVVALNLFDLGRMDDAKKLLDSLMGQTRNMPTKEAKKKKGHRFKEPDACKFYLLGFCPQHEQLFRNTKRLRHLEECTLIHSDAYKEEFEAHPDKEEYEATYTRDLIRHLEGIVRTADECVQRHRRNIEAANRELEERGPNEVAKREIERIKENCSQMLAEAEELAEKGDVAGSKAKQEEYQEAKAKVDEYETRSLQPRVEEVCEICGLRPEDGEGGRVFSHEEGKIHKGFVRVREFLKDLRERQKVLDKSRDLKRYGKDSDRDRERDRERGREEERKSEKNEEESKATEKNAESGDAEKSGGDRGDGDRSRRGGGRDRDDRGYDRRGGDRRDGGRDDRRGSGGGDRDYGRSDRRGDRDSGRDRRYRSRSRDRDRR